MCTHLGMCTVLPFPSFTAAIAMVVLCVCVLRSRRCGGVCHKNKVADPKQTFSFDLGERISRNTHSSLIAQYNNAVQMDCEVCKNDDPDQWGDDLHTSYDVAGTFAANKVATDDN